MGIRNEGERDEIWGNGGSKMSISDCRTEMVFCA